jgi:hypothetical protein
MLSSVSLTDENDLALTANSNARALPPAHTIACARSAASVIPSMGVLPGNITVGSAAHCGKLPSASIGCVTSSRWMRSIEGVRAWWGELRRSTLQQAETGCALRPAHPADGTRQRMHSR